MSVISTITISPRIPGAVRSTEVAASARYPAGDVVEFVQRPREGAHERTSSRFHEPGTEIELFRERRAPQPNLRALAPGTERFGQAASPVVALSFLAQHIAQEVIPGAARNGSDRNADGVAAYAAAAARTETVLGPVGSIELVI